jgi:hypothetical protein
VSPASLPEVLPEKRDARRCLPSRGSLGSRFPTFPGPMRRSDDPLSISGHFARRSLPDTGPASWRSWGPHWAHDLGEAPRSRQGLWSPGPPFRELGSETDGSPTFPRDPSADMPRSQTPVVSWALAAVAHRIVAFRCVHTVGLCLDAAEALLLTTTLPISGRNDAACLLAHSGFVRPLLGWHAACTPDRLARRSSGGTGTSPYAPPG